MARPFKKLNSNAISSVVVVLVEGKIKFNKLLSIPQQKSDRSVDITVDDAQVSGGQIKVVGQEGRRAAYISYWIKKTNIVNLSFNVHSPGAVQAGGTAIRKPGRYAVYINYAAANNAGGTLKFSTVNKQFFKTEVPSTGNWNSYQRKKIGEIILRKAGKTRISLQATNVNKKGFINLKSIQLIPID